VTPVTPTSRRQRPESPSPMGGLPTGSLALRAEVVHFLVFMAVVYFAVIIPYRHVQARRGVSLFGEPAPTTTCPYCLSGTLPLAATKCRYCGSDLPPQTAATDVPAATGGPAASS
ncbi:MAG: hypothetical protein ACYCVO_09515, partial [Acidimicrobiales bacterium]